MSNEHESFVASMQSVAQMQPDFDKLFLNEAERQAQTRTELRTHPLYPHLVAAIEQAMYGKGERHGGARTPFLEQPWLHYAKLHGPGFLTGQAAKKLEEAASTKTGEAYAQEIRGAIVYLGMALIYHDMVK